MKITASILTALFLSLAVSGALAAAPAISNGVFAGYTADGKLPGWRLPASGVTVESEGGRTVLVLRGTAPNSVSMGQELPCSPDWGILRFRYRVSVPAITPGALGWHDARIALSAVDAAGKVTHMVAGNWPTRTAGWLEAEQLIELPAGTVKLGIGPAIFNASGELRLADLRVELAARRGQGIDAPPPAGQAPQWGAEPVETISPRRATICLNGLWRFMPAHLSAAVTPLETGWGWLRVPGSWRPGPLPAPIRGSGPCWQGFNGESPAAWYERELFVPADWAGRAILLDLQRVCTDAAVFIDEREVGKVAWPGGEVDLTAAVKPGQKQRLRIKVVAVADGAEVTRFMGTGEGQVLQEKAILATRGIVGDVLLVSRPAGAHLTGCAIRTSVKAPTADTPAQGDTLSVVADYRALPAAASLTLTAIVRDAAGAEVRRFTATAPAKAGDGSVSASWTWNDPQLWEIHAPTLYTLELALHGAALDDAIRETFGFREFRIAGKRFLLNGTEIRLRPAPVHSEGQIGGVPELIGSALDGLRWAGFNTTELWPWNRDERGTAAFDELWCQEADRRGFLLVVPANDQGALLGSWTKPGVADGWAARMTPPLKRLRNHPSLVMWVTGANRFGHGQDQNPVAIGSRTRAWLDDAGWRRGASNGLDTIRRIQAVDPTRPVFMHAGGPVGDVYTANNYLCLLPLQEREEWPSRWAADGDMPVMMVEFGTPLYVTLHRGRRGYAVANTSEPLYTEFCAIYQGAEAYRLESPDYRATLASTFSSQMLWTTWHTVEIPRFHEGFNQLQALFQQNTWRTWRTWGVTGGMLPWSNGHGWLHSVGSKGAGGHTISARPATDPLPPFVPGRRGVWQPEAPRGLTHYFRPEGMPLTVAGQALVAANQETLAWIAGAPDFVDKSHHVRSGATLAKQAALINDGRAPADWSLTWRAELDGAVIAEGSAQGRLAPAATAFAPLQVPIPDKLARDRVPGMLRLTCTIGTARHEDRFAFTAFRAASTESGRAPEIALLDPVGETAAMLRALNIASTPWDGAPTRDLVVIGRNAFAKGGTNPAMLARHLQGGGRVLLLAQDPAWLRERLGLRIATAQLARRAFPAISGHRALAGLDAEAFRDWNGESRLLPPIDAPNDTGRTPPYGWRWGARHAVSSAPIEIPHRAGWRPLLTCEFDGAYTPLAEIAVAGGALLLCTLDLEDHAAADPAAERVTRALLAAAAAARPETRAPAAYLGGGAGAAPLAAAGLVWERADALPRRGLAIIGPDAVVSDADLEAFLRRGGRALILPRTTAAAPLGVRLAEVANHAGSIDVPAWASCRGLTPGELRRRANGPAWVVSGGADEVGADGLLAEVRRGRGVALFCQLDTTLLDADRLSYNRYTRWRWTRALSQLAANLGGLALGDDRLVRPIPSPDTIPLSGTWKALLTTPMPETGVNEAHPRDPGPSPAALARIAPNADESGMETRPASKEWESYGGAWTTADGEAVFRRVVDIPAAWAGSELLLSLGTVDDFDTAYFDGVAVGSTSSSTPNFWNHPRRYTVPGKLVTPGRHVIAVRVFDHFGGGGLTGAPDLMVLKQKAPSAPKAASLYHADYRDDFPLGDDPYRYYRW